MDLKRINATLATLLLCTLPACVTVPDKVSKPLIPDAPIVAPVPIERVNGVAITKADLFRTMKNIAAQNNLPEQLSDTQAKQAEAMALEQLESAELLYQEANKTEVKDLDFLITQQMDIDREKFPSQEAFEKAIRDSAMTMEDARLFTRKQIVINKFVETHFASKETATEDEAKKFYEGNLDKYFKKGEMVRASHILIKVPAEAPPEVNAKAKEKAEAILKRVQGGEDFAAIAQKESDCPSKAQGGNLGTFGKGKMVPAFETAAFALKPGEVSSVIKTQFGYHVIKLTDKIPAKTEKFEDMKEKILQYVKLDKVKKAVKAFVAELRSKAKIEKV